jgi:hypothetical protein
LSLGVLGVFVACAGAKAVLSPAALSDNPYQGIVERNVFSLRSPPPPPPPPSNEPPPPKLLLTGITTILGGTPRALLKGTPPAAKGEQPKEQFYMLSEGQRDGEIEVLAIDVKGGMVKVNDYGTVTNLTFDKDGVKLTSSSPANNAPAAIQPPPGSPFGTIRTLPQRTLRFPGMASPASAPAPSGGGVSSSGFNGPPPAGYGSSPSVNVGGASLALGGGAPPGSGQPQVVGQDLIGGDMAPEAYAALLEAQREATKQDVLDGKIAPLPVTRYTPPGSVGSLEPNPADANASASGQGASTTPNLPLPGRPPGIRPY